MLQAEFPKVSVAQVRPLPGAKLSLRFSDGMAGVFDCAPLLQSSGPMVQPLRDPAFFAQVFLELGAPTWPNGYDLDPVNLYTQLRDAGALSEGAIAAE